MAIITKKKDEYIVIHHVFGEADVVDFLRMTSHTIVDRLCFEAKTSGQSFFRFRNATYKMTLDKGALFQIEIVPEEISDLE